MAARRIAHFALNAVGVVFWICAMACFTAVTALAILGHKIWPDADRGNCWTWALPRWWREGGGLYIVPSGLWVKVGGLRIWPVLHAALVHGEIPNIQQTEPIVRRNNIFSSLYFRYRVISDDRLRKRWEWRNKGHK